MWYFAWILGTLLACHRRDRRAVALQARRSNRRAVAKKSTDGELLSQCYTR
ncbi:cytochrome bd-I oxidase subunit CydX [Shigella flexneri]